MIDAHKVVDYLKKHFNQSDTQIVLLLSQGILLMKDCHHAMMETGNANIPGFDDVLFDVLDNMNDYISDIIDEELEGMHDRL